MTPKKYPARELRPGEPTVEETLKAALEKRCAKQEMISVPRASLLVVVRQLDYGDKVSREMFAAAFDDLRCAFEPDEIATGQLQHDKVSNAHSTAQESKE